jgi:TonB family protein
VKIAKFIAGGLLVLPLVAGASRAGDITTYHALSCELDCPQHVPAKPLAGLQPSYPSPDAAKHQEGFVDLSFVVGTDGHATNPIVEQVVGSKALLDAALAALKLADYQPATDDGKPVAENRRYRFFFEGPAGNADLRDAFDKDYGAASALADDNRIAEAISKLKGIAANSPIDIQELLLVAYTLAQLDTRTGDYASALKDIRIATIDGGAQLTSETREKAFRLRLELEAQAGELIDFLATFDTLQKVSDSPLLAGDPDVALAARLHAQTDTLSSVSVTGRILSDGGEPHWQHTLLHRTFGFSDLTGTLAKFTLRCEDRSFQSSVIDKAQWNVPRGWADCVIYVYGAPDTTFKFVETTQIAVEREGRKQ